MGSFSQTVSSAKPQDKDFVIKIDTRNTDTGSTNSDQFALPLDDIGSYNFNVDWGDGSSDTIISYNQAEATHTYSAEGEYFITIRENAPGGLDNLKFTSGYSGGPNERYKVLEVIQWGPAIIYLNEGGFIGFDPGDSGPDFITKKAPAFGSKSLRDNFWRGWAGNGSLENWSTTASPIISTNGESQFRGSNNFNNGYPPGEPNGSAGFGMDTWDTSGSGRFDHYFNGCSSFNTYIGSWDLSNKTQLNNMFSNCSNFNNGSAAGVSGTGMNDWVIGSSVANLQSMFSSCVDFNQDLSDWDFSAVTTTNFSLREIFTGCSSLNQDFTNWSSIISKTSIGYRLFDGCTSFNNGGVGGLNAGLDTWDVSNLKGTLAFNGMFKSCSSFNQYIGSWSFSTTSTFSMSEMFNSASSFNQDIGGWNMGKCTSAISMFRQATAFNNGGVGGVNTGLDTWDVSGLTSFNSMFSIMPFNQYIGSWDTSSITSLNDMFYENGAFNQDIGGWDVSNVTNFSRMFWDRFTRGVGGAGMSFNQDLSNWDVSSATTFDEMFFGCRSMSAANIASLNSWNVTSSCAVLKNLFNGPSDLSQLDLSGWDVSGVTNFWYCFARQYSDAGNGFSPNITGWTFRTGTVLATGMFYNRLGFNEDISGWNIKPSSTQSMFSGSTSFNQNLGSWDISSCSNMSSMLNNTALSDANYSSTLIGWAAQAPNIQSNVSLGATGLNYNSNAASARSLLTGTYGWTITDAGPSGN